MPNVLTLAAPRHVLRFAVGAVALALSSCGSTAEPSRPTEPARSVAVTAGATAPGPAPVQPNEADRSTGAIVAVGVFHGCASVDSLVTCWGENDRGQLGRGNAEPADGPVAVQDFSGATLLAAGDQHTCAVVGSTGEVWCWGLNDYGQLGIGDSTDRFRPTRVNGITDAVLLTAGDFHTCAVSSKDRSVWCWGMNISGQVGREPSDEPVVAPRQVDGLTDVVSIDAGFGHTCAVEESGAVSCWGDDVGSQAGGAAAGQVATIEGVDGAIEVRVGMYASCARNASGEIRCWGQNDAGQFGTATIGGTSPQARVVAELKGAEGLAVGKEHVCALIEGGVSCLGARADAANDTANSPVFSMPTIDEAVAIDGHYTSLCAAKRDRTVWCWNYDEASPPQER